jgi:hypothetical protein
MQPTVREADRLVVLHGGRPRAGRLAVVRFADGVVAVKRLERLDPEGWWVTRDNPVEGRDSWSAGAVPPADVLAVVLGRLWPRPSPLRRIPGSRTSSRRTPG